jgi:hypothetical protein
MPNILMSLYKGDEFALDRFLSVKEQIESVGFYKNIPPEEKLYQWMTNLINTGKKNFDVTALAYASPHELEEYREVNIPN